jgi:8-oxo-dGTP diphosphatase
MKIFLDQLISDLKDVKIKINVAAAIIYRRNEDNRNEILLIQRSADDYFPLIFEIPRGKCDKGPNEGIEHCLLRETKEETGLSIKIEKFIDSFSYLADEDKRLSTQHNFLCTLTNPNQEVKLSKEHQDYRWVCNIAEVRLLTMPELAKVIEASNILDLSDLNDNIDSIIKENS